MPGHDVPKQQATIPLRVVVVGGNVGGMATAYTLQAAGHNVVVLEKSDGQQPSWGAVRSPPNMTRLLTYWGLEPLLKKYGLDCTRFAWRTGETGEVLGYFQLGQEFMQDLLANFTFIQHGDLLSMIRDIALREGVDIRYNSEVDSFDKDTMTVTLKNGQTVSADFVVSADGPDSAEQHHITEEEAPPFTGYVVLSLSIPAQSLRADPELKHWGESDDWSIWVGSGYMIRANLVAQKQEFSLTLTLPNGITPAKAEEIGEHWDWSKSYTLKDFDLERYTFEPKLHKMMSLATEITATTVRDRQPQESMVCDDGLCVLVGQSAHPLTPDAMHPASMAIEDAEVLGNLFSRLHHKSEISRLLDAYEELRIQRCTEVQRYEPRKVAMLTMVDGPDREARDERLKASCVLDPWTHMDEKMFKEVWGEELGYFTYDAAEQVDDWWTKWGSFMSPHQRERGNSNSVPVTPLVEVSVSKE